MSSIYRIGESKNHYITIKFEHKNGKDYWFIECERRGEKFQLIWHDFEILIRHLYVFWGYSKMTERTYEEIYELVKSKMHLISGEDIIGLHYLK